MYVLNMKGTCFQPSFYGIQNKQEIDIWSLKQEQVLYEQQMGKYSFIVIENRKKEIVTALNTDGLKYDSYINE